MKIAIVVEGGCVAAVYADKELENIEIQLLDRDVMDEESRTEVEAEYHDLCSNPQMKAVL